MDIKTTVSGNKATIALAGKLTVQASPDLHAATKDLSNSVCDLDIDLADVSYIASAGLRALVATDKFAVKRGGLMRLLHPRDEIWEVMEMSGFSEVFAIER